MDIGLEGINWMTGSVAIPTYEVLFRDYPRPGLYHHSASATSRLPKVEENP